MNTRIRDARAAEHGLRALEELVVQGDAMAAEVTLGLIGLGVEALGDRGQQERLEAARRGVEDLRAGASGPGRAGP